MRSATLLVVFTMSLVALIGARQTPASPQATFKSGVDLIQLDVSVLDKDRKPVRDLTAADFTILQDGRQRRVASFKRIDIPPTVAPSAPWIRDVAPDVTTNAPVEGRVVLIVIDDGSFDQIEPACPPEMSCPPTTPPIVMTDLRATEKAREVARTVIGDLGPADVAAVLFTENNYTAQEFTGDRSKLLAAVNNAALFPGPSSTPLSPPNSMKEGPDFLANTRGSCYCGQCTSETLARIGLSLRDLPGQRKTMFFISSGVAYDLGGAPSPGSFLGVCAERKRDGTVEMLREAQLSNVTVHSIDPKGLLVGQIGNPLSPDRQMIEFLRTVSETTGGRAVVHNNAPEEQVQTLLDEGSSYYLLGFEATGNVSDGKVHSLKVRVNRPDVEVVSRTGFSVPTVKELKARAEKRGAPGSLDDVTSGVLATSDVRLSASAAPFLAADGSTVVAVVLGVSEPGTTFTGGGARREQVGVTLRAFDPMGNAKGSRGGTLDLTFPPTSGQVLEYEALLTLPLLPGRYALRLGAKTGDGLAGSVYSSVGVPDFAKEPLSLSGLVLASVPSRTAVPNDAFSRFLNIVPTARRQFEITDRASTLVRVYQGGSRPIVPVTITTRVVDDADREVASDAIELGRAAFQESRSADYRFALPIDELKPGEYLLRVHASSGRESSERTLRFTVR